jgi:hypothetical protein
MRWPGRTFGVRQTRQNNGFVVRELSEQAQGATHAFNIVTQRGNQHV